MQVDVAVTIKAGIIVFEVKDYSGWIFVTKLDPIYYNKV